LSVFQIPPLSLTLDSRALRVYNGHRPVGLREKRRETMAACKWCGQETIVVDGDSWQTICRECMDEAYDSAADSAEAAATGN
jgi:hypothetical protein